MTKTDAPARDLGVRGDRAKAHGSSVNKEGECEQMHCRDTQFAKRGGGDGRVSTRRWAAGSPATSGPTGPSVRLRRGCRRAGRSSRRRPLARTRRARPAASRHPGGSPPTRPRGPRAAGSSPDRAPPAVVATAQAPPKSPVQAGLADRLDQQHGPGLGHQERPGQAGAAGVRTVAWGTTDAAHHGTDGAPVPAG